jgi:hypothetical protein
MGKTLGGRVEVMEDRRFTDWAWKKPELSTTKEPRTTRWQGVEKSQKRLTRQGGVNPRRLNDKTGAQGKKERKKEETATKRG